MTTDATNTRRPEYKIRKIDGQWHLYHIHGKRGHRIHSAMRFDRLIEDASKIIIVNCLWYDTHD